MDDRHQHSRREQPEPFGPTPEEVADALEALSELAPTEIPAVSTLRTLEAAGISPTVRLHNRKVLRWKITNGKPRHGELRSDDHVSKYKVVFHEGCPECGHPTTGWEYSAHHHIAGHERKYCPRCGETHEIEEWA